MPIELSPRDLLSMHHTSETCVFNAFHLVPKHICDLTSHLDPKLDSTSRKKCHKNENHLTNKNLKTKNDIDLVFCIYKGGNTNNSSNCS